ncbi:hypothetical protein [Bradyrhizobium sp.]|uniref:hypothetical protein n=1 Tax=Bradyrhizobium sp. TaxID=376 RepID=UPI0026397040|nr:hypothetical protein [Bradyrhizobium sp.]
MTPRNTLAEINLSKARSRVTNGTRLLVGVDGRSPNARRFRDLVRAYEAEFESVTEVDRNLIRQAALLALKSEQLQAAVVRGDRVDTETITNLAGQLRRTLADMKRKAETTTAPAPTSILEQLAAHADEEDGA